MRQFLLAVISILLLSALTAAASAESKFRNGKTRSSVKECSDSLLACFSASGVARNNCLDEASAAESCKDLELGKLAFKRFLVESGQPLTAKSDQEVHGFLGPALVDADCLIGFDNQLSGYLIKGETNNAVLKQLSAQLDACRRIEEPVEFWTR